MFAIATRTSSSAPAPTRVSALTCTGPFARVQHRAGDPRAAATYRHAIRDAVAGDDGRLTAWRAAGSSRGDWLTVAYTASRYWDSERT